MGLNERESKVNTHLRAKEAKQRKKGVENSSKVWKIHLNSVKISKRGIESKKKMKSAVLYIHGKGGSAASTLFIISIFRKGERIMGNTFYFEWEVALMQWIQSWLGDAGKVIFEVTGFDGIIPLL